MNGSSPTAASPTPANAEAAGTAPAVAVACSGGPDSMALLWTVWRCASASGVRTRAFHVHHGLQAVAREWPAFIEQECARWARMHPQWPPIELHVRHLPGRPARGQSLEAWAREGRHAALQELAQAHGVDLLLLAHHRQDQAETFLLQALRGAGPQGLAGMPRLQWRDGVCWARPFLHHGRQSLRHVLEQGRIRSVEDPSNEDPRFARNALRRSVWPALSQAFEQAEVSLAAAAHRCAQALETLEQGARADQARGLVQEREGGRGWVLDVAAWNALSPSRRSQVLRLWFAPFGVRAPASLVDRLAAHGFEPGRAQRWPLDEHHELRWYRGVLSIDRVGPRASGAAGEGGSAQGASPAQWTVRRAGGRRWAAWQGRLVLRRRGADEWGADLTLPLTLTLRDRQGDDRFQLAPRGVARSLKKQFQARAVPAWDRHGPVVTDGRGVILWVPGLGWDARVAQVRGGWGLEWQPDEASPLECRVLPDST